MPPLWPLQGVLVAQHVAGTNINIVPAIAAQAFINSPVQPSMQNLQYHKRHRDCA
ncbi:hypothetical protein NXC24_CH01031 [Rhizobium sp. NXC24]|nr:hypothetical protein NXC24_CH01031 [Rhizobium sp. NXC24]